MSTKRVYDLPTRIFHGLFAASFLIAFSIANTVDDDGAGFSYHMIAGLVMCFTVLWRILWGIIGSQHARFSDFSLKPNELISYLKRAVSGKTPLWAGHNPASSWAAVTMMVLALGLGLTGYLMVSGNSGDSLEDIHELMANAFIIVVLAHIAGIAIHSLKHKDSIGKSIVTGYKQQLPENTLTVKSHTVTGVIMLALTLGFASYLVKNFDSSSRQLTLFGTALQLAEHEDDDHDNEYGHDDDEHDDDDYDDDDHD